MKVLSKFTDKEVEQLLAFLEALTSPSVSYLSDEIPAEVPSGLPIAD